MIKETLKIFSQNVRKNKTLMDIILENNKNTTDIIFIQEPPRYLIWHIPSHTNPLGDPLYGFLNYPVLWEPQEGTSFLYVQTLDCKYQVVQCKQDINSMGT